MRSQASRFRSSFKMMFRCGFHPPAIQVATSADASVPLPLPRMRVCVCIPSGRRNPVSLYEPSPRSPVATQPSRLLQQRPTVYLVPGTAEYQHAYGDGIGEGEGEEDEKAEERTRGQTVAALIRSERFWVRLNVSRNCHAFPCVQGTPLPCCSDDALALLPLHSHETSIPPLIRRPSMLSLPWWSSSSGLTGSQLTLVSCTTATSRSSTSSGARRSQRPGGWLLSSRAAGTGPSTTSTERHCYCILPTTHATT